MFCCLNTYVVGNGSMLVVSCVIVKFIGFGSIPSTNNHSIFLFWKSMLLYVFIKY
jgi:hypothetical protein